MERGAKEKMHVSVVVFGMCMWWQELTKMVVGRNLSGGQSVKRERTKYENRAAGSAKTVIGSHGSAGWQR